jgi:hypothetical protein
MFKHPGHETAQGSADQDLNSHVGDFLDAADGMGGVQGDFAKAQCSLRISFSHDD